MGTMEEGGIVMTLRRRTYLSESKDGPVCKTEILGLSYQIIGSVSCKGKI